MKLQNLPDQSTINNNPIKAITIAKQILSDVKTIDDHSLTAKCLLTLGICSMETEDFVTSSKYLIEGLQAAKQAKHKKAEAYILNSLSNAVSCYGDFELSEKYLAKSRELSKQLVLNEIYEIGTMNFATLYIEKAEYRSALVLLLEVLLLKTTTKTGP